MRLEHQTWKGIDQCDRDMPVVIPLGSIEQHGHHLPLCTDTAQVDHIAKQVEMRLAERILLAPTLWLGSSHHHRDFPGTLSVRPSLYTRLIQDLAVSLLGVGFRKLFFLNGHGGNETPLAQALGELAAIEPLAEKAHLVAASWWRVGPLDAGKLGMQSASIAHACEYETSAMLAIEPKWVQADHIPAPEATGQAAPLPGEDQVTRFHRFAAFTTTGAVANPAAASADKGQRLLAQVVDDVVRFLEAFERWPQKT